MSTNDAGSAAGTAAGTGQITVYQGPNVVYTFSLTMPVLTIGRAPDNMLPLSDDHTVSSHHAELRLTAEGTILTDLGSTNGTLVGGVRIAAHQPYLLAGGTVFYVGSYGFVYEEAAPAPPEPAQPDGSAGAVEALPVEPEGAVVAPQPVAELAPQPVAEPVPAPSPPPPREEIVLPPPAPPPPPRPTWGPPSPPGPLSDYLRDLPIIFADNEFLGRYLLILESIWEPLEQRQDHVDLYFDPRTCPPSFLPWLASWLDPALETHWPEERLRDIMSQAIDLYRWRGTRFGLARMIELCTGIAPRITEDPAVPFCFGIRLEVPRDGGVDRRLVEQLIVAQKPAHAGYSLEMAVLP